MNIDSQLSIWGTGQLLAFSGFDGPTDYQNGLVGRTSRDYIGIDIKLPCECSLYFSENKIEACEVGGDFFQIIIQDADASTVKGAFVDCHHLLIEGYCEIRNQPDELKSIQEDNRTLIAPSHFFNSNLIENDLDAVMSMRKSWLQNRSIPADLSEPTHQTLVKALSIMKTQVYSPEGNIKRYWTTPDRWPHKDMWLWDSAFHAIGLKHADIAIARQALNAILETQRPDGFIAHQSSPTESSSITQPPILALAINNINNYSPDPEWIEYVYPFLKKYIDWDITNRDSNGDGLLEWYIHSAPDCRSGESGLDNSPRFDCATQLDAVDFNAMLSHECELLAQFALQQSLQNEADYYQAKHQQINQLINSKLWDESAGFYFDFDLQSQQQSDILACTGFLPLICGAATEEQARKLVSHLTNPNTFNTPFPVASIAQCNREHYSKDMWRGPTWINTNWLIAYGLKRYNYDSEANALLLKTREVIEEYYLKYGVFFEFYDDRLEVDPPQLLRKRKNIPDSFHQVFHDYGWTATLYADMVYCH